MTWLKLPDDFTDECWDLSDGAFRLMVELLNYSNKKLLDGLVPLDEFRRFARNDDRDLAELLGGGWVAREGAAIRIVFCQEWQPTRDQQLARAKRNQENGRKGGRPRKPPPPETQVETQVDTPDGNPTGLVGSGRSGSTKGDHLQSAGARAKKAEPVVTDWPTAEIPRDDEWSSPDAPGTILAKGAA